MLAIDLHGHGESAGQFADITVTKAAQDVVAAVGFLQRQKRINPNSIGALGHSMGGTAVLIARARGAFIKTLVLVAPVGDSKYHANWRYTAAEVRAWRRSGWYRWTSHVSGRMRSLRYYFYRDLSSIDSIRLAENIQQPVLIVHGTKDEFVPLIESRRLFRALHDPKQLTVLRGADHDFFARTQRRKLFSAVLPWLREYLSKKVSRSVAVFIMRRGKLLIMKRSQLVGYYRGAWGVIGGHVHKGVHPIDQAYLEVREETGLRRSDLKLVRVGKAVRIHDSATDKTWLSTPLLFEAKTRRVKLDWEHTAYKWISMKRFPFRHSYPGIEKQFKALGLL